jgi:hypothetical protein
MEIVARRTKATDTDLYIFISDGKLSMSLIVLWNKQIIPWNKDCLWRIEEISHRTDSLSS